MSIILHYHVIRKNNRSQSSYQAITLGYTSVVREKTSSNQLSMLNVWSFDLFFLDMKWAYSSVNSAFVAIALLRVVQHQFSFVLWPRYIVNALHLTSRRELSVVYVQDKSLAIEVQPQQQQQLPNNATSASRLVVLSNNNGAKTATTTSSLSANQSPHASTSSKLNFRDYIIELLSIFATTYGWSVFTLRSIARKRIKYIVLGQLIKLEYSNLDTLVVLSVQHVTTWSS